MEPDLILLDLNLPDMTGLEALLTIQQITPSVRVLIVSASGDPDIVAAAFENGACGYILKDSSEEEFTKAIEAVLSGRFWCSPQIAGILLTQRTQGHPLLHLTQRERTVLFALARGLSNAEIAQSLHLSKFTVQNYVSIIYQKLGVSDRWKAADIAKRLGAGVPELLWNRGDDQHAFRERND
jgi:DNA-binding NarL/FixJ family response regulator